jgi:predicted metal-dependent hydrolase
MPKGPPAVTPIQLSLFDELPLLPEPVSAPRDRWPVGPADRPGPPDPGASTGWPAPDTAMARPAPRPSPAEATDSVDGVAAAGPTAAPLHALGPDLTAAVVPAVGPDFTAAGTSPAASSGTSPVSLPVTHESAPSGPSPIIETVPDTPVPPTFRHPRAQREIRFGEHLIAYELRRARRRSIGFVVGPEGLSVSAPRWVGVGEVESALREKERWIVRKLQEQADRARRMQASRIEWRDGAQLPFLGEPVILVLDPRTQGAVLNTAADALPGVPRLTLHLGLPQHAGEAQVRELVQSWLQRQARRVFEERCALFATRLGVRVRRIGLSSATTRWGSASADGSIRLHWRLVHFALPVIDYVVTHELAHLREMNHSPAFWDVVRSVMPDYEKALGTLRDHVLPSYD